MSQRYKSVQRTGSGLDLACCYCGDKKGEAELCMKPKDSVLDVVNVSTVCCVQCRLKNARLLKGDPGEEKPVTTDLPKSKPIELQGDDVNVDGPPVGLSFANSNPNSEWESKPDMGDDQWITNPDDDDWGPTATTGNEFNPAVEFRDLHDADFRDLEGLSDDSDLGFEPREGETAEQAQQRRKLVKFNRVRQSRMELKLARPLFVCAVIFLASGLAMVIVGIKDGNTGLALAGAVGLCCPAASVFEYAIEHLCGVGPTVLDNDFDVV